MSSFGFGRGSSTRTVRKIEPPRPLKSSNEPKKLASSSLILPSKAIDSAEKLLLLMDAVVTGVVSDDELSLIAENKSLLTGNIITLCENLKIFGPQLENSVYRGQLDRAFHTFREGIIRNNLELEARVHLLDILELRECNWVPRKNAKPIVVKNLIPPLEDDLHTVIPASPLLPTESTTHLGIDEIVKSSGKYRDKPSKTSKNYCKEEIIIRNADSGKVMGIKGRRVHMIEQLSDTIISFQKVQPNFKERLVQITGPNEEKITYATHLIEDTIRNNASPVRELGESVSSCSSDESYERRATEDDNFTKTYQYKHKVMYNDCVLTITGNDYNYVTLAKAVLDDYFSKLGKSEYYDVLPAGEFGQAGDYSDDNVFMDQTNYLDETTQDVNYNGSGDIEEDEILKQLHKDLNNINFEPESSLSTTRVSLSESFDETNESIENKTLTEEINNLPRLVYTKEFLLECRKKAICQKEPEDWQKVKDKFPHLVKSSNQSKAKTPSPVRNESNETL